ncbi:TOBE domain-containing protein [Streptomyces sp. bgisy027]|uniref:TOBE domain-containing protein n=1 Tax=Streptomyces sp. bgisy027 TaxID=3413770 RepID=UPI003D72D9B8
MVRPTPRRRPVSPGSTGRCRNTPSWYTVRKFIAGEGSLALAGVTLSAARDSPHGTNDAQAGVRPEYVKIVTDPGPNTFPGSLQGVTDHGAQRVLEVEVAGQLVRTKPRAKALPYADGQLVLQS